MDDIYAHSGAIILWIKWESRECVRTLYARERERERWLVRLSSEYGCQRGRERSHA